MVLIFVDSQRVFLYQKAITDIPMGRTQTRSDFSKKFMTCCQLFRLVKHSTRKCTICDNLIISEDRNMGYISLNSNPNIHETTFYDSFKHYGIGSCNICGHENRHLYSDHFTFPIETKYTVMYTSLFSWSNRDTNGAVKINSLISLSNLLISIMIKFFFHRTIIRFPLALKLLQWQFEQDNQKISATQLHINDLHGSYFQPNLRRMPAKSLKFCMKCVLFQ